MSAQPRIEVRHRTWPEYDGDVASFRVTFNGLSRDQIQTMIDMFLAKEETENIGADLASEFTLETT